MAAVRSTDQSHEDRELLMNVCLSLSFSLSLSLTHTHTHTSSGVVVCMIQFKIQKFESLVATRRSQQCSFQSRAGKSTLKKNSHIRLYILDSDWLADIH